MGLVETVERITRNTHLAAPDPHRTLCGIELKPGITLDSPATCNICQQEATIMLGRQKP